MYKNIYTVCLVLFLSSLPGITHTKAEEWPQFRGPNGQGHSSEQGLPQHWSETRNIAWKVPIPGRGWSSPVIQGEQLWLTSSLNGGRSLRTICLNRDTGEVLKNIEVFQSQNPVSIHSKNSHASPTPVLEKDRVYVHYGSAGTACLSTQGQILWNTQLQYDHGHGPGGSPILFRDLLIVNCDGTDVQFVVALDKQTGKVRWKQYRDGAMAFSTPLVIQVKGRKQVICISGDRVVAYEPTSGQEIWWLRYNGFSNIPRPVFGLNLVFISSGFDPPATLFAVRPNGRGDVTDTHVAWRLKRSIPLNPSPLLIDELLYIVSDRGVVSCLNARTGSPYWRQRLSGNFSASPVYADGRIYFLNEEGETTVIAPGTSFKRLATNSLEGTTLASLSVSDKAIFLRTDSHLYRIEKRD